MSGKTWKATLAFACLLQFASALYGTEMVVRTAPPVPQSMAVIGRAPGPRYVWTGGYYRWNRFRYIWVLGRWFMPPRAGMVWIAPRWIPRNGGFVFVPGRWR